MADDFFQDQNAQPVEPQAPVEPEKIKLGEKEYSPEELQKLVGLGEIGAEAERQYKTSIKSVWPKYQQVINEKRDVDQKYTQELETRKQLEERIREFETKYPQTQPVQQNGQQQPQFTPEQIRTEALKQAEELGIGPQAIRKTVMDVIQGQNLLNDISSSIDEAMTEGWVKDTEKATIENVLNHMQTEGIKNPTKALRDMFETDYLEKQTEKLAQLKQDRQGLPTVAPSTAGAKLPSPTNFRRMDDTTLTQMINDAVKENYQ